MEGAHRNGEQYLHAHEFCRMRLWFFSCLPLSTCELVANDLTILPMLPFIVRTMVTANANGINSLRKLHVLWPLNSISNVPIAFAQMAVRKSERHFAYVGPRNLCSDIKFTDDVTMKN
ncbi:hypothetical protein M514_10325 [Trichuris suis]|uniref:Uncharacterized protein n=1 Tax=Trichuris suis TaxID=68888 RepID=A0A085NIM4_9BILA|nr:hypothetical protein M514_10325 [Trichuris suis]